MTRIIVSILSVGALVAFAGCEAKTSDDTRSAPDKSVVKTTDESAQPATSDVAAPKETAPAADDAAPKEAPAETPKVAEAPPAVDVPDAEPMTGIDGTWRGRVSVEVTESLNDTPLGNTKMVQIPVVVTIENEKLTQVTIVGFAGNPHRIVDVSDPATPTVLSDTINNRKFTQTVSVIGATVTSDGVDAQFEIGYEGTLGKAEQTGTGSETITARLVDGKLNVELTFEYLVMQSIPETEINLNTGQSGSGSGTLARR